jgi:NAD(P)-dependent dehydrogenase (short-subunit alcohol dehydrogenase family)
LHEIRDPADAAIVNNASIAGMIADPGISAYVAAKHGVIGLSKAAAIEYAGQGIRINALAPGLVETAMTKHWFDDPKIRAVFLANSPSTGANGYKRGLSGKAIPFSRRDASSKRRRDERIACRGVAGRRREVRVLTMLPC